ncbi:MAG: hypothetical protein JWM05_3753 [Acidimicrobiales bacterium]|nr:hypothetical protein [Acidimicrobiales bacterium]
MTAKEASGTNRGRLQHGEFLLDLAADAAGVGAWEWDIATGAVRWNGALEALYGLEPGTFPGTYDGYVELLHPDDRANARQAVQRTLEEGGTHRVEHRVILPNGEIRWVEGRGGLIHGPDGAPIGMAGITIDATSRRRAAARLDAESRIIEALNETTRRVDETEGPLVHAVLEAATTLTGARFGAFFAHQVGVDGRRSMDYTVVGVPPEAFADFALPRETDIFRPTYEGRYVVRYDDVTASPHFGKMAPHFGLPAGHPPLRSYLAAPVAARGGEVLGGIFLGHPEPGVFDADDERVLVGLSTQAALAMENGRLHALAQRELAASRRIAEILQRSLRPPPLPAIPSAEVAARYRPLLGEVGGDFYDLFAVPDGSWLLVVGDVCGKGTEAAALTSLARWGIRTAAMAGQDPEAVLRTLNELLVAEHTLGRGQFVTALCAQIRFGPSGARADLVLGGHPQPLVRRSDGRVEPVGVHGTMLGAFPTVRLRPVQVDLAPGDSLVAFTDGATELRRDGGELGQKGLISMVESIAATGEELVERLDAGLMDFGRGSLRDDLALIALTLRGA